MKVRPTLYAAVALSLFVPAFARAEALSQKPATQASQEPTPPAARQTTLPPQAQGAAPLRVIVHKSLLINPPERLKRISVPDPTVASVQVVTPTQILVHGKSPGEV